MLNIRFTDVIWDFDGTLFDTYPGMANAFQKALGDEGINESIPSILVELKVSVSHAIEHFKQKHNISDCSFAERFSMYESQLDIDHIYPFPNVEAVCRSIIDGGGHNHIYTHRGKSVFVYLERYNLLKLFTGIVNKDHNLKRKPDPDGFLYIINKYDLDRSRVLAVGDRTLDIAAAKNAGISSCLINESGRSTDCSPDYTINYAGELYRILDIK